MSQIALGETAAWLDALYGRCDTRHGAAVVVSSSRREIVKAFPLFPQGLVDAAHCMHANPGCYLKINTMNYAAIQQRIGETGKSAVGKESEVQTVVSFHLDVDAGKAGYQSRKSALWAVNQMPLLPTMLINSDGERGGFHAYWLLQQPHLIQDDSDRKRCRWFAKHWHETLKERCGCGGKLDSTFNLDRVLRCVGVPRLDGGEVTCEYCDFTRMYKIEDFYEGWMNP